MADAINSQITAHVTREQARESGIKKFVSLNPCPKGHLERYTATGQCTECQRANRARNYAKNSDRYRAYSKLYYTNNSNERIAYSAQWRATNPEKMKEQKAAWYVVNADKARADARFYAKANPGIIKAVSKRYYAENVEARKAASEAWRRANPDGWRPNYELFRALNPDKVVARRSAAYHKHKEKERLSNKAWKKKNPEAAKSYVQTRRARKISVGGKYTAAEIKGLVKSQNGKCAYCRTSIRKSYQVDHIMPLSAGGSNWIKNIQL
jgi:hypothetical protein